VITIRSDRQGVYFDEIRRDETEDEEISLRRIDAMPVGLCFMLPEQSQRDGRGNVRRIKVGIRI
jgi:hypothetical protein